MNKGVKHAISGTVLVLVVIGGWWVWQSFQEPQLPSDLAVSNGRIEAVQVDISTKIAGRVKTVLAKEGDLVQAQQALAQIDTAQLHAQKLRAEADVASASSLVASAQAPLH